MEWLADPQSWIGLLTLTVLEIVLGIDNIIFLSILVSRLAPHQQHKARIVGLALAMLTRIALLFSITWLITLTAPLFTAFGQEISGRDLILILGGLFLLWKSTMEIHQIMEGEEGHASSKVKATFGAVIFQVILIDLVFSLDSIITAVGMVNEIPIMVAAVVVSVGLMMVFAGIIGRFVSAHPTIKVLALSFLFVVGVALIAEGFDKGVPKGYIYFAMAFSVGVEMLNIRMRKKAVKPVDLREPYAREFGAD